MKTKSAIYEHAAKLAVPISKRDHIQGSMKAPFNLVEYGDYECPYCGKAYSIVKEVQADLGDKLCFVFRNFPLIEMHPHSESAAEAAEAAGGQGQFWEMHDMLYENQSALEDEDLASYAQNLDLDVEQFVEDLDEGTYQPRVQEDIEGGIRSDVTGTPMFFVNGCLHRGDFDFDTLIRALEESKES